MTVRVAAHRSLFWMVVIALAWCAPAWSEAEPAAFDSPEDVKPLPVGAKVPSVVLHSVSGEPMDLAERVREHGALLVFYRGGW